MNLVLVLVLTALAVFALRYAILKAPWVFYLLAILADFLLLTGLSAALGSTVNGVCLLLFNRGALAAALFAIVMWIGVFPREGKVAKWLRPIRAELSIMACLLIAGHMMQYLSVYLANLDGGAAKPTVLAALCVALVLLVLMLLLGVTSVRAVKQRISAQTWRRIQAWAYAFYALVYVHVVLALGSSALAGGTMARETIIVYSVVFIGYFVARIVRAMIENKQKEAVEPAVNSTAR